MLAPILIAVLAFIAVGAVGFAFAGKDDGGERIAKRAKELAARRRTRIGADSGEAAQAKRKQQNAEALKELEVRQRRTRKMIFSVKGQLDQAALKISVRTFWLLSAVTGLLAAAALYFIGAPLVSVPAGWLAGTFGVPRWVVGMMISARQKKFTSQFAEGVDIIVRGIKSGLPLNQCLRIIATESSDPLRSEFKAVCDGQAMGVPLDQNLQRLYERMPLPEVNFFAIVLVIQQKTGGNLSEALGNLSSVLRSRKLMKEKVKALSSEAKASGMIIGSLPVIVMIMVYLTRPAYIMTLFTDPMGHIILVVAVTMMATGILVMRKMINFKF